jgi:hypothetical protein
VWSQEAEEDKKRLAQELILGWTHAYHGEESGGGGGQEETGSRAYPGLDPYQGERGQEVEEDKKRLAKKLILGWTHTKVREVKRWKRTRKNWLKSLSWAGPIPR